MHIAGHSCLHCAAGALLCKRKWCRTAERFHLATDGSKCQVLQPNIEQSLESPSKQGKKQSEGSKDWRNQRDQRHTWKMWPTELTDWDSWGLTEIREPVGSDLGPLHICYDTLCSCGNPAGVSGGCLWLFAYLWDPFSLPGLSHPAWMWSTFSYQPRNRDNIHAPREIKG